MAKADAVFTIGADASAFVRETKKVEVKYERDSIRGGVAYVRAQNGGKTAFIRADAAQAVWDKAERFFV